MEKIDISSKIILDTELNGLTPKIKTENEEFYCHNLRQLSKQLGMIRLKFFRSSENENKIKFFISLFYFKRINKEKTTIQIIINNIRFSIIYEYLSISKENIKIQKKELCGNLIEEIIENFQPLREFKFYSDNLNNSGNYTIKHIVNDCKILKSLGLNNILFSMNEMKLNNMLNENLIYFQNFGEKTKIENYSLSFFFDEKNSKEKFIKNFNFILDNLIASNTKNINFTIYHEDYIDFGQKSIDNRISSQMDINDFKVYFINTNTKTQHVLSNEEIYLLPFKMLYKYTPEFLELNFVEILSSENSKIETNVYIFKISKILYTKRFFCVLNSLKNKFSRPGIVHNNFNYKNNQKILDLIINYMNFKTEDIFEIKTNHLQLMLPKVSNKIFNSRNFLFNLINDYESLLQRKIRYEEIFEMITLKSQSDNTELVNIVKLKKYDLNSISKIFSKIDGNCFLFLKDGREISIGGKFKKIINKVEYSLAMNTIIEINKNYSRLKIVTFDDKYFLSNFSAAAVIFDEENVVVIGGISIQELLPNFAETPIFKIDLKTYQVSRILPSKENKIIPGVIFNHKIKIIDDNLIEISEGYIIKNYSGGLSILDNTTKEKPRVEPNTNLFFYDLRKNIWNIKSIE